MINWLVKYLFLFFIVFAGVLVCIITTIVVSGSRETGMGYGLVIGILLGNLVFSLLQKGSAISKILAWLISCVILIPCSYLILNYVPIQNTVLTIITTCLLPLVISWEITRRVAVRYLKADRW